MRNPNPIIPDQVRTIPQSFSWIDRRIITLEKALAYNCCRIIHERKKKRRQQLKQAA